MTFMATLLYVSSNRQSETARWLAHSHEVISQGHELLKLIVDMETGERGYLITGNKVFLEPFYKAKKVWASEIDNLKRLVSDNPEQVKRLIEIDLLQTKWLVNVVQKEIDARSEVGTTDLNGMNTVISMIDAQTGKNIIDKVRVINSQFIQAENTLLLARDLSAEKAVSRVKSIVVIGIPAILILAGFLSLYIFNYITKNLKELVTTTKRIAEGDFDKPVLIKSTDEFSILGHSFNSMAKSLKESIEVMESAVKVKTDFLANMSHEIRTPMNGILGMLTLLEDTNLNKQQLEYIESIRSCGDGLLVVINDILDISKLEAGKLDLEQRAFDLQLMVNETCYLLNGMASQKGIVISISIDHKLPKYLVGDRLRIRQVLLNLLSNAIKFTNKGAVQLNVVLLSLKQFDCSLVIEVIDKGIGIASEDLDRLFKPFSQVDTSTTRLYGGTGLGLTICAQLIKQMGGNISVKSEDGQGSTFSLSLNLAVAEKLLSNEQNSLIKNKAELAILCPLTILVAEDNNINQIIARKLFSKLGYTVDIAVNGLLAVTAVKNKHYDIIFMDMQMPEMDGVTATKEILKLPGQTNVPIVAMTANVMDEDKQRCIDAGMVGFIGKPINIDHIINEIIRLKS
jgi:signal transduction histidine kinase